MRIFCRFLDLTRKIYSYSCRIVGFKGRGELISYSRTVDKTNRNEKQPIFIKKLAVLQVWLAAFAAGQAISLTYIDPSI
jgi:hypothetical protein